MEKSIRHGTPSGYTHGRCRCGECKAAMKAYQAQWRAKNKDRILARDRSYYDANRERIVQSAKTPERRKANAASKRKRYKSRRDVLLARVSAYQATKPAARTLSHAKRRAALRTTDRREITSRDWRRLCARHGNRCAYCGQIGDLTVDHVVPLVRGGRHAIGNLLPACGSCNSSKNACLLVEWAGRPQQRRTE